MASINLGLPEGFEAFHDVKGTDDLDDVSVGDMSLLMMGSTIERNPEQNVYDDDDGARDGEEEPGDGDRKPEAQEHDDGNNKSNKNDNIANGAAPAQVDPQPHMVSADSMATIKHGNMREPPPKKPSLASQTPYDSLKDLVKSKKRQFSGTRPGNVLQNMQYMQNNGIVSRPSTFLRQAMYGSHYPVPQSSQNYADNPNKKGKMGEPEVTNPLLHKACTKRGVEGEVIEAILRIDKNLAGEAHQIVQAKDVYDCVNYKFKPSKTKEKYSYPLNIAIRNHAKAAAVELLLRAAPHVATYSDGHLKECSLSVLLKHSPHDAELVDLLLLSNPDCAKTRDKNQNTPLHVACQYGVPLSVIKHICIMYPQALRCRNRFGYTPLEVAQRSNRSGHIANYLFGKQRGIF